MFFVNPKWKEIYQGLLAGSSALLHCPKQYGNFFFYKFLEQDDKIKAIYNVIFLCINSDNTGINYEAIFKIIQEKTNSTRVLSDNNAGGFMNSITAIMADKKCLFIFKITHENVANSFTVVNGFHNEIQHSPSFAKRLAILVLDDYSLYYHKFNGSQWDYIHRKWCGMLDDENTVLEILRVILPARANHYKFLEPIMTLTGGHEGLITESLLFLKDHSDISARSWERKLRAHLETCDIFESIGMACSRKSDSFFITLHYYGVKHFTDDTDANVHEAHKIGVILKMTGLYSILCPGIITESLQEKMAAAVNDGTYIT